MINLEEFLNEYNLEVTKITYYNNYIIIETINDKYLLKVKDSNKKELFDYLESINYSYYLPIINSYSDYYELYPYYDDKVQDQYTKAKKIVEAFALLQMKSLVYVDYNEDRIKGIYENLVNEIDVTMKYYLDLQDYIEQFSFPNPAYYLLIKNLSNFYELLRKGRLYLDKWYEKTSTESIRESLLINNLSLDNFRFGDYSYFIDYKDVSKDLVIYDFVNFYKEEIINLDMISLFDYYKTIFKITISEFYLICALISIPIKIKFSRNAYNDTVRVRRVIDYVIKTLNFISEEDKKYQETNEDKLEE